MTRVMLGLSVLTPTAREAGTSPKCDIVILHVNQNLGVTFGGGWEGASRRYDKYLRDW